MALVIFLIANPGADVLRMFFPDATVQGVLPVCALFVESFGFRSLFFDARDKRRAWVSVRNFGLGMYGREVLEGFLRVNGLKFVDPLLFSDFFGKLTGRHEGLILPS